MKLHVIVGGLTLLAVILACAMAGPIDKEGIDYNNLRGAAKFQAREVIKARE